MNRSARNGLSAGMLLIAILTGLFLIAGYTVSKHTGLPLNVSSQVVVRLVSVFVGVGFYWYLCRTSAITFFPPASFLLMGLYWACSYAFDYLAIQSSIDMPSYYIEGKPTAWGYLTKWYIELPIYAVLYYVGAKVHEWFKDY